MLERLIQLGEPTSVTVPRQAGRGRGMPFGSLKPLLPAGVVLLALSALVAQAIVLQREIGSLRHEIGEVFDPARLAIRDIQFHLSRETASTRGYLLTGDTSFMRRHVEARRERIAATATLASIANRSSDTVRNATTALVAQLQPADVLLDSLYAGQLPRGEYLRRLPAQQQRFEEITSAVREVGILLSDMAAARVSNLERLQRATTLATFLLAGLAAISVMLVAHLGWSYRLLARRESLAHAESELARQASERARAEADERRAETDCIAASRSRLVRGFTHDVKNPLGAASGTLQLADEGLLDTKDAVRRSRRSVETAIRLIDDLLHLARAESSVVEVRREPVQLCALASELVEEWRGVTEAKGIALTASLLPTEAIIYSDADKVRQIVGNLVSNAVHYTTMGFVTVRVGAGEIDAATATTFFCLEVRDTGPGLTAEQRALLFQEFRRLDTATGTRGHGLGLASSNRIATALGGRITVESTPGQGSTFCLWLPQEPPAAMSQPRTPASGAHRVVDLRYH